MAVFVTAISPATAMHHEHIAQIRWLDCGNNTSQVMSVAQAVAWVRQGNQLWVAAEHGAVQVRVMDANPPYLRTVANNTPTDNLLHLPRY